MALGKRKSTDRDRGPRQKARKNSEAVAKNEKEKLLLLLSEDSTLKVGIKLNIVLTYAKMSAMPN